MIAHPVIEEGAATWRRSLRTSGDPRDAYVTQVTIPLRSPSSSPRALTPLLRGFGAIALLVAPSLGCRDLNDLGAALDRHAGVSDPPKPETEAPPRPLTATFTPAKGAPEMPAVPTKLVNAFTLGDALPDGLSTTGELVEVRKDYPTADDPHRKLGLVFLDPSAPRSAGLLERLGALRSEAARHGANLIVAKGCRSPSEGCAAFAFYLSSAAPPPPPPPVAKALPPAPAEEILAALAPEAASSKLIRNNKAMIKGLIGFWLPNASDAARSKAHDDFEREMVRSMIYVELENGKPALTEQGMLLVMTDEASADPGMKVAPVPGDRLIELAVQKNLGIQIFTNTGAQVFTALTPEDLRRILAEQQKKPKKK
jgi:hypothetical protein